MQARSPRQPATQRMRLLCGSSHPLVDLSFSSPGTIPGMLCGLETGSGNNSPALLEEPGTLRAPSFTPSLSICVGCHLGSLPTEQELVTLQLPLVNKQVLETMEERAGGDTGQAEEALACFLLFFIILSSLFLHFSSGYIWLLIPGSGRSPGGGHSNPL